MKILIVEDDHFHKQVIEEKFRGHLGPDTKICWVRYEKEFVQRFNEIAEMHYDLAILDQMMPWTDEDDEEYDADAPKDGPLRAGTRCWERLKATESTKDRPAIFFTNLEKRTVPDGAPYVRKKDDEEMTQLLQEADRRLSEYAAKIRRP